MSIIIEFVISKLPIRQVTDSVPNPALAEVSKLPIRQVTPQLR